MSQANSSGWGTGEYPSNWAQISKEVKERDRYTCQNCGAKGGKKGQAELHAHHIVPKSKGGSHRKSNLTTLCWNCHNDAHDHYIPRMSDKSTSHTHSKRSRVDPDSEESFAGLVGAGGYVLVIIWGVIREITLEGNALLRHMGIVTILLFICSAIMTYTYEKEKPE